MKSILFKHETEIGTFWMHAEPAGRMQLGIDRQKLKTYRSPNAAAQAVKDRSTGWPAWDKATDVPAPFSLRKWKRPAAADGKREARIKLAVHLRKGVNETR